MNTNTTTVTATSYPNYYQYQYGTSAGSIKEDTDKRDPRIKKILKDMGYI